MSTHQSTTRRGRRTIGLACGSLAVLAIAGTTATQAFAAAAHTGHRATHHAALEPGTHRAHKVAAGAHVRTNTTTSLADAVTAVAADSGKVTGEQPNILEPGSGPAVLKFSQVRFAPTGGTGFAGVQVIYRRLDMPAPGNAYPGSWKNHTTTTLADGSVVRTQVTDDGSIVEAERTVGGVVETAFSYASPMDGKDGHAALTSDQLTQVVAQLTPPTS